MSRLFKLGFAGLLVGVNLMANCNLEQNVELDLPVYESQMVIECYMVPGQRFQCLITESVGYFEPYVDPSNPLGVNIPTVDSALVLISYSGITDTLYFGLYPDIVNEKIYNYRSNSIVPQLYHTDFTLEVIDQRGRKATAVTRIKPPVEFDSTWTENINDFVLLAVKFKDDEPGTDNYFRRQLHYDQVRSDSLLNDDVFSDELFEPDETIIRSAGNYVTGDRMITTLIKISFDYYDFITSFSDAINSNGNPFAVPAPVRSNIDGGLGIFAGYSISRDTFIIP